MVRSKAVVKSVKSLGLGIFWLVAAAPSVDPLKKRLES